MRSALKSTVSETAFRASLANHPTHSLYVTGDRDAPRAIRDLNGCVVLSMCRACHRAEIELAQPCDRRPVVIGG